MNRENWHNCRWCGNRYRSKQWTSRDGFCTTACKQAHYRAYKKYVTGRAGQARDSKSSRGRKE